MKKSAVTMSKIALVGLLLLAVPFLASCGKQKQKAVTQTQAAEAIVDFMAMGDFASATADFDATMKSQLTAEQLGQVWNGLAAQVGSFKERTASRETQEQGYKVVYVTCRFEKSNVDVKVVFDSKQQVAGLFMVPSQPPAGGS